MIAEDTTRPGHYFRAPNGTLYGASGGPMSDRAKAETLRGHLDLIMSQIDYTDGACRQTDKIGTLVKPEYLEAVRTALRITK